MLDFRVWSHLQALMYQSGFVDEYDVGLRLPTRWCDSNTCYAVVMALRKASQRSPILETHDELAFTSPLR